MSKYIASFARLWLQPLNVDDHLEDFHAYISNRLLPAQASPKHDIVSSHSRFLQLRDLLMRFTIILKSNSVSEVAEDVKDNLTLISTVGVYNVSKEAAQLGFGLRPEFWDVDPASDASMKLVETLGVEKGETLKNVYQLASDVRDVIETKRDQVVWRLERPR
ncbi:hypothetical protein BKA61DRAFT_572748 [Leptodontidium sp. MPI-SDFR-AT-0119]|nr:hypothetical protein BKA61DRAFT_572748 [Leptodontidium sp. MPI-SDFR-AT-0119]